MQHTLLFLLLLSRISFCTNAFGQTVRNPGFETPRDTLRTMPADWRINRTAVKLTTLDSTVAQTGRHSLKITRTANSPAYAGRMRGWLC